MITISQNLVSAFEDTTQQKLYALAIFKTANGKNKLVDIHFPDETIRKIIDSVYLKIKQ